MKFFSFFTAIGIIIFFVAIYLIHTQNLRKITIKQTSLNTETWLEVEKNEVIKICIDSKVLEWKTSLNTKKTNDYCLKFQTPMIIGTSVINVKFPDSDSLHKINLAVGMKYLDFKKEEVLLGFRCSRNKNRYNKKIRKNIWKYRKKCNDMGRRSRNQN